MSRALPLAVALASLLAGCGQGPSVSAGTENSSASDVDLKRTTERSKSVSAHADNKMSATQPVTVPILSAAQALAGDPQALERLLRRTAARPDKFLLLPPPPVISSTLRAQVATVLVLAHEPQFGWPVDPEAVAARDLEFVTIAVTEFADRVEANLARLLDKSTFRDPVTAAESAQALLLDLDTDLIRDAEREAVTAARAALASRPVPDLASNQGIAFTTAAGSRYSADGQGWTIVRRGAEWFGKGLAGGKKLEITLEDSASSNVDRKLTIGGDETAKSAASQKAGADIK